MNKIQFYLTNIITGTDVIDNCSNYFLTPLHGLLELTGRTAKIYKVDLAYEHVDEIPKSQLETKQTAWKVICISLQVLFFLPATAIGICLKGLAQLKSETSQKHKILFDSIKFDQSVRKLNSITLKENSTLKLTNDVVLNLVFQYLSPKEILYLRNINKVWWNAISNPSLEAQIYRDNLNGMPKRIENEYSFQSLALDCKAYAKTRHYSSQVIDLFDGIHNLLRIPLIEINEGKSGAFTAIEEFTRSLEFLNHPSSILRINMRGYLDEAILIKYTQFIPAESEKEMSDFKKGIPKKDYGNDKVWHDYFVLLRNNADSWFICDAKFNESINEFREKNQYPICPPGYSIHFKNLDDIKILLKGDVFSFEPILIPFIKPFTFRKQTIAGRTFENLPVLLGHVSLEKMLSLFEINYAPFAVKKDKTTYLASSEIWAIKKEHSFAEQHHLAARGRFLLDFFFSKHNKLNWYRRKMGTLSLEDSLSRKVSVESPNKIRKRAKSLEQRSVFLYKAKTQQ